MPNARRISLLSERKGFELNWRRCFASCQELLIPMARGVLADPVPGLDNLPDLRAFCLMLEIDIFRHIKQSLKYGSSRMLEPVLHVHALPSSLGRSRTAKVKRPVHETSDIFTTIDGQDFEGSSLQYLACMDNVTKRKGLLLWKKKKPNWCLVYALDILSDFQVARVILLL
jgi:hypothetical protein